MVLDSLKSKEKISQFSPAMHLGFPNKTQDLLYT